MSKKPDITLYFLGASRGIRIAWLLEELKLPYNLVAAKRAPNGVAPPEFKKQIPNPLGKSPTIKDGDVVVTESGAIIEYLLENYDPQHKLLSTDPQTRAKEREWLHAAEGTFAVHTMGVLYARWKLPEEGQHLLPQLEEGLSGNINNDFNWLEGELKAQKAKGHQFLVGDHLSAADIMLQFSIQFIFARKLGVSANGKYPEVEEWLKRTEETEGYKAAVKKTGYDLFEPGFKK